jgi:hypothetical protein
MNKFKKIAIYTWIAVQVVIMIWLWGILLYTAFTNQNLPGFIHWEWWVFFFTLDLWSAKFYKELNKATE